MDTAKVTLRYGTDQAKLEVTVNTDTEATSVSDRYLSFKLPHSISAAKSAVSVEGVTGKMEIETIYDDDQPFIGLEVKVTAGASAYDVTLGIVGPDSTHYSASGKSGETVSVKVPLAYHPNAETPPHNSTLPPEETEATGDLVNPSPATLPA